MGMDVKQILNLAGIFAGILSFLWVGFRRDLSKIKNDFVGLWHSPFKWQKYSSLSFGLAPYLIFLLAICTLTWCSTSRIKIHYHAIRWLRPDAQPDFPSINMEGRTIVELPPSGSHLKIKIGGCFFGPELRQIQKRFGSLYNVKVYAIVSERSRPRSAGLLWVQAREYGILDQGGNYVVEAYIGGTGADRAQIGEMFEIRIFVPDSPSFIFPTPAVYDDLGSLPKSLLLSEPIYVRIRTDYQIEPDNVSEKTVPL